MPGKQSQKKKRVKMAAAEQREDASQPRKKRKRRKKKSGASDVNTQAATTLQRSMVTIQKQTSTTVDKLNVNKEAEPQHLQTIHQKRFATAIGEHHGLKKVVNQPTNKHKDNRETKARSQANRPSSQVQVNRQDLSSIEIPLHSTLLNADPVVEITLPFPIDDTPQVSRQAPVPEDMEGYMQKLREKVGIGERTLTVADLQNVSRPQASPLSPGEDGFEEIRLRKAEQIRVAYICSDKGAIRVRDACGELRWITLDYIPSCEKDDILEIRFRYENGKLIPISIAGK